MTDKPRLYVTFTKDEMAEIESNAKALGLSKSAYVRLVYKQSIASDRIHIQK